MNRMFSLTQALAWLPGARLAGDGGVAVQRVHTDTRSLQRPQNKLLSPPAPSGIASPIVRITSTYRGGSGTGPERALEAI